MKRVLFSSVMALVLACGEKPTPPPPSDAGDLPVECDAPDDCVPLDAVCRQRTCQRDVPCGDSLECALGERCVDNQCRFRGCTKHDDCESGFCDVSTFSCAECSSNVDCNGETPVCRVETHRCVECSSSADCQPPGHPHCSNDGACVACVDDAHCASGLRCVSNRCVGLPVNSPCPMGVSCAEGLACVKLGANATCLPTCSLYEPSCASGEICFGLTYSTATSLIFESSGPLGVCFAPQPGARGLREPCARSVSGSNCQPNLQCVPETATLSLCRAYCDPLSSGMCGAGEVCTRFVGDFAGREYGVCLPDSGFGERCEDDAVCRAGLSCQPWDDPAELDLVSGVCQFQLGDGGVGAPCRAQAQCRSAACVSDPYAPSAPYFCFNACQTSDDCEDAGVCDADFTLSTAYGTSGQMRGCRPTCSSESDCAVFDAGLTCRARVVGSATAPEFSATCSPPAGALPGGAACVNDGECRSHFCVLDDSRGVRRSGVCAGFCGDVSECAGDGGLDCAPQAFLVSRGRDAVANTLDDVLASRRSCVGVACASDDACGEGVCSLQRDAFDESALVKRCAPPTSGTKRGGAGCTTDVECRSGVCGTLQAPSTGVGRACFEACSSSSQCESDQSCRVGGLLVGAPFGAVITDSCAP